METKVKNSEAYVQLAHDLNVENQRNKYFYRVVNYLWIVPVLLVVYFVCIYLLLYKDTYDLEFAHGVIAGSIITLIAIAFLKKVVVKQKKFAIDKDENLIQAKALEQWYLKNSDNRKQALIQKLETEERKLTSQASRVNDQLRQLKDY